MWTLFTVDVAGKFKKFRGDHSPNLLICKGFLANLTAGFAVKIVVLPRRPSRPSVRPRGAAGGRAAARPASLTTLLPHCGGIRLPKPERQQGISFIEISNICVLLYAIYYKSQKEQPPAALRGHSPCGRGAGHTVASSLLSLTPTGSVGRYSPIKGLSRHKRFPPASGSPHLFHVPLTGLPLRTG